MTRLTVNRFGLALFIAVDLALAVALVFMFLWRSSDDDPQTRFAELGMAVFPEPPVITEFAFTDHRNESFTNKNLLGKWNLVFFGFTSCPDVCPLSMNALQLFYNELEDAGSENDVRVLMVTVDPQRDDPKIMAAYVTGYHQDFIGLSGAQSEISGLASDLFIAFSEPVNHSTDHDNENYIVPHSGYIAFIDPEGNYRGVLREPHSRDSILQAYEAMRSQ